MVETEFGKLNLGLNKKKFGIIRIMKKALKKPETKEAEWIKFINQNKYLGFNLQNCGRPLKKMTKMIFLHDKLSLSPMIFKIFF
jgi:hypothetical protein